MTTNTLEQIGEEVEVLSCGNCRRELKVSVEVLRTVEEARRNEDRSVLGRSYDGFFVSPESGLVGSLGYYCDKQCHEVATED